MLKKYINPIYADFNYETASNRHELGAILTGLIAKHEGIAPAIDFRRQVELCRWDRRKVEETPRISLSWNLNHFNENLHKRLEKIFSESILDESQITSKGHYKSKRRVPSRFIGYDGHSTGKSRGFPMYQMTDEGILDPYDLSREEKIFWITRNFSSVKDAREKMRGRGSNYWFYSDGKFNLELRLAECKEIEFIDTALRISVALNGNYDSFDRNNALSLVQKHLARRNKKEVSEEEIVGMKDLIEDIKFRQFFSTIRPDEAKKLGVTDESVLLVGVPGIGKSLIASSLLWDSMLEQVAFIPLNVTELLEASYSSDKEIDNFFSGVRDLNRRYGLKPMLWCDDLESAFLDDMGSGSKTMAVTQSTLLNNLQGVSKDFGMRISGSTNYPEKIDQRFLEFGRISYIFHIPIPRDPIVLSGILSTHVKKRSQNLAQNVILEEIASNSIGFTPRMLVNLVNEAGVQASKRIFKTFNSKEASSEMEVTVKDYEAADKFLREKSDINLLAKRDEEIATFVTKKNKSMGFGRV